MTSYRMWSDGYYASDLSFNDSTGTAIGVEFYVTRAVNFTGMFFWQSQHANTGVTAALYWVNDPTTNQWGITWSVDGLSLSSFPSWNRITPPAPITLTANQRYRAVIWSKSNVVSGGGGLYYSATTHFFEGSDLVNGPLVMPSYLSALAQKQAQYDYEDPVLNHVPNSSFNNGNYWIDVEVTDIVTSEPPFQVKVGGILRPVTSLAIGQDGVWRPVTSLQYQGNEILPPDAARLPFNLPGRVT